MKSYRIILICLGLCFFFALGVRAQRNLDTDHWKIDSERGTLLAREKELSQRYDELQQANDEIERAIGRLRQQQDDVLAAMRAVRSDMATVKLKLL